MPRNRDWELARICLASTLVDPGSKYDEGRIERFLTRNKVPALRVTDLSHIGMSCIGVETPDSVVVCFRCSDELSDWKRNLDIKMEEGYHRGWWLTSGGVLPGVLEFLLSEGNGKAWRLTGHSLGGALSILLLVRMEGVSEVVTFGSPKTMTLLRSLEVPSGLVRRYENSKDPVPFLPPLPGLVNPGERIVFKTPCSSIPDPIYEHSMRTYAEYDHGLW